MPGEAAGVFNNDDAHAVADNPLEQRREAWPPFDRILAAHCGVSKFVNDLETGSVGKSADGVPLAAAQEFGSFLRCYRHVLPALARRIHDPRRTRRTAIGTAAVSWFFRLAFGGS